MNLSKSNQKTWMLILLALTIMVIFALFKTSGTSKMKVILDKVLNPKSTEAITIDFLPAQTSENPEKTNKTALIILHGGAWVSGNKNQMTYFAKQLNAKGHTVINLSYRLAPQYPYPSQIKDISNTIKWLKSQYPEIETLQLMGYSAGAHLALLYAYQHPQEVSHVISIAGPTDLTSEDSCIPCDGVVSQFISSTPPQEASPLTYFSQKSPSTLVFHAEDDSVVSVQQTLKLQAKAQTLQLSPQQFSVMLSPQGGHEFLFQQKAADQIISISDKFLRF